MWQIAEFWNGPSPVAPHTARLPGNRHVDRHVGASRRYAAGSPEAASAYRRERLSGFPISWALAANIYRNAEKSPPWGRRALAASPDRITVARSPIQETRGVDAQSPAYAAGAIPPIDRQRRAGRLHLSISQIDEAGRASVVAVELLGGSCEAADSSSRRSESSSQGPGPLHWPRGTGCVPLFPGRRQNRYRRERYIELSHSPQMPASLPNGLTTPQLASGGVRAILSPFNHIGGRDKSRILAHRAGIHLANRLTTSSQLLSAAPTGIVSRFRRPALWAVSRKTYRAASRTFPPPHTPHRRPPLLCPTASRHLRYTNRPGGTERR